jgi:hypothetical protein
MNKEREMDGSSPTRRLEAVKTALEHAPVEGINTKADRIGTSQQNPGAIVRLAGHASLPGNERAD